MDAQLGIEPRFTGSEPVFLPLEDRAESGAGSGIRTRASQGGNLEPFLLAIPAKINRMVLDQIQAMCCLGRNRTYEMFAVTILNWQRCRDLNSDFWGWKPACYQVTLHQFFTYFYLDHNSRNQGQNPKHRLYHRGPLI